uniref:CCHC-type domain-containing protein n=1 Tax=Tetradesmus obliquus TaxID=3088 RepID=A0A383W0X3_TETOB|eukprot:jgi/Sobl393_1/724/SZX71151.1
MESDSEGGVTPATTPADAGEAAAAEGVIATRQAVATETSPAASKENENLLDGLSSDDDMAPASTASDDSKANYRRDIVRLQEVVIQANEATAAAQAAAAQARQEAAAAEERAQTAEALHQSVAEQLGRSDAVIAGMQGILTDALQGSLPDQDHPSPGQGRAPAQQQTSKRGRSRSRDRAGSSYAAAAQRGQSSGARPSHGQQPNRQGFGSPDNMRTYKNKKGQSFQRNAHLVSWMVKKDPQPCWSCYTPGHQVKDCTASPARGNPPGYVPPQ